MIAICLLLIPVAVTIGLLTCRLMIRLAPRWGLVDKADAAFAHKADARAVPTLGGVGIFAAVALPLVGAVIAAHALPDGIWASVHGDLASNMPGLRSQTSLGLAVLGGLLAMHVLGLVDDRRALGPGAKLAVQMLVAAVLAGAFDLRVFHFLDGYGAAGWIGSIAITVLWVTVITNAMNYMDNMDGLSAGVGAIVAAIYLVATLIQGQWFVAGFCALIVGGLLGFLVFNFHPARLYMGDGGSLVLGMALAVVSIRTTYYLDPALPPVEAAIQPDAPSRVHGVLMPLIVMAVPLYDLASVTLLRLLQGRNPFRGDKQHFSHRLVRKGLGVRGAVIVIWLCTLATGLGGVMLGRLTAWQAGVVGAQTLAVLGVLAMLDWRAGPNADT